MTDYKRQRDELAKQTEALQAELAEQRGAAQRELDAERRKVDELNEAVDVLRRASPAGRATPRSTT